MGFTHFFPHKEVNKKVWGRIVADCKKLHENMPPLYNGERLLIDGCFRFETPQFNGNRIHFNGTDPNFTWEDHKSEKYPELSHETFMIERVPSARYAGQYKDPDTGCYFTFCKTARKPYDLMVTACLLVYKHHSPETMALSSDGNANDWQDAERFVKSILGYEVKFAKIRYYRP